MKQSARLSLTFVLPALTLLLSVFTTDAINAAFSDEILYIGEADELMYDMAYGDIDGDGDPDIVTAANDTSAIFENQAGILTRIHQFSEPDIDAVSLGDMDNDGDLDIVFARGGKSNLIYYNDLSEFTLGWESPEWFSTREIELADMDGDGQLDLVVANDSNGQRNQIYRNIGNRTFVKWWQSAVSGEADTVAVGDVDGDGDLDMIFEPTELYRNNNDGTFTLQWDGDQDGALAFGDVDQDGDLDLAIDKAIYDNDGNGNFTLLWDASADSSNTADVAFGDWDGDHKLDLASANGGLFNAEQNVVYRQVGNDNWVSSWQSPNPRHSYNIAWVDLTGDGKLDLASANRWNSELSRAFVGGASINFTPVYTKVDPTYETLALAWGDFDGDHWLDYVVTNEDEATSQVYRNNQDGTFTLVWERPINGDVEGVAVGDSDGDGDLDIAFAIGGLDGDELYANDGGANFNLVWKSADLIPTDKLTFGDIDNDGDLDLAAAHESRGGKLYRNNGNNLFELIWETPADLHVHEIIFGDMDGDGDLDLALANGAHRNGMSDQVYRNDQDQTFTLVWESPKQEETYTIAWADADADGDLDLAAATTGDTTVYLYENLGQGSFTLAWATARDQDWITSDLAWGDADQDGDLDLFVNNYSGYEGVPNRLYRNEGNFTFEIVWEDSLSGFVTDTAWGDYDRDGDLDLLFAGLRNPAISLHENLYFADYGLPNTPPRISVVAPSSRILTGTHIALPYLLKDADSDPVARVEAFYSPNGGGQWFPAVAATQSITSNLATSPAGEQHTFVWDTFASGFFGQSDRMVVRLVAHTHNSPRQATGVYSYPHQAANPSPTFAPASTTRPFRVQGTQVQVLYDNAPVANAHLYRQSADESVASLLHSADEPLKSDNSGYIRGGSTLSLGDQLYAFWPMSQTERLTLYYSNAQPTLTGAVPHTVTVAGTQQVSVSAENPLLTFNLNISLEWDAREDSAYLLELERNIQRASQILYDISDGQIALGEVNIYQDRAEWLTSDVVIYATNDIVPNATLGGVADRPITRTINTTNATYHPGQIRMPSEWNRFGNAVETSDEDWARTLAHELGHYLLYLPDNYLGLNQEGLLVQINCVGSMMTDAYKESYSELLDAAGWQGDCLNSVANRSVGIADWEMVQTHYPALNPLTGNSGPTRLPFNVTNVQFHKPTHSQGTTLPTTFYLRDSDDNPVLVQPQNVTAYLIQSRQTASPMDDQLLPLGNRVSQDVLLARGAKAGDLLCVFDRHTSISRGGCTALELHRSSLRLQPMPNWAPEIEAQATNSTTLLITVTQSTNLPIELQLFPTPLFTDTGVMASPIMTMSTNDNVQFTQSVSLPNPTVGGYVRIRAGDNESISSYYFGGEWGPNRWGWEAGEIGWGPNRWGWEVGRYGWNAPVLDGKGRLTLFALDYMFGDTPAYAIHTSADSSTLSSWLTPVGSVYSISFADTVTSTTTALLNYMERDLPDKKQEAHMHLYYLAQGSNSWVALPTVINDERNIASAFLQGSGQYVLAMAVPVRQLVAGWNDFGYPLQDSREITTALASIEGKYTSVYGRNDSGEWLLYDSTVRAPFRTLVNTLHTLSYSRAYWIYATESVTPLLGIETDNRRTAQTIELPPATYYGYISHDVSAAQAITTWIDGALCGSGLVQEMGEQLVYHVQVSADKPLSPGIECGQDGSRIEFKAGDDRIGETVWHNSHANYLDLGVQSHIALAQIDTSNSGSSLWRIIGVWLALLIATASHSLVKPPLRD